MNNGLPKVSCLCPTFARTHLLEEAVHSFLQQDYEGEKELIVCNDFVRQHIECKSADVIVANLPARCPTLGDKRNATARMASGELLLTWGDDDIHLPHRISRMVRARLKCGTPMVREGVYFSIYGGKITKHKGFTTGAHIIETAAYWRCGGIPPVNCGEDRDFNDRVKACLGLKAIPHATEEPAFVYRFSGTQRTHISALGDDKPGKKSGYQVMLEKANELVDLGREPSGAITLNPCWRNDYVALMRTAIPEG